MLKWLLKSLLKSLLILIVLVLASIALPLAAVPLLGRAVDLRVLVDPRLLPHREQILARARSRGGMASASRRVSVLGRQGHRVDVRFPVLLLRLRVRRLWETHSPAWMAAAAYFPVAFTVAWCARG